jgi:hypothetical protein
LPKARIEARFRHLAQRRFLADQLAMNQPPRNHRSVVAGACHSLDPEFLREPGSILRAAADMTTSRETLVGSVARVTFHNEENGFAVLKVKAR